MVELPRSAPRPDSDALGQAETDPRMRNLLVFAVAIAVVVAGVLVYRRSTSRTGAHASVQCAAAAFRDEAARMRNHFVPAATFPLPEAGRSRFYVITNSVTLQTDVLSDSELRAESHPLHALARQAQNVIATVRQPS